MNRFLTIGAVVLCVALAGCGGGKEKRLAAERDRCLMTNWKTMGYQDGSQGRDMRAFEQRGNTCSKHGVSPELDAYVEGRNAGLKEYCRPRQGFNLGASGYSYNGVCPAGLEQPFMAAYGEGKQLYDLQVTLSNAEQRLANAEAEDDRLGVAIEDQSMQALSPGLLAADRLAMGVEIKRMAKERKRLKKQLPALRAERDAAAAALESYRAHIARRYPGAV